MDWHSLIFDGESYENEEHGPGESLPRTRADCPTTRPCPYMSCRHHIPGIEIDGRSGEIRIRPIPLEAYSCSLDIIDEFGELDTEQIAAALFIEYNLAKTVLQIAIGKLRESNDDE